MSTGRSGAVRPGQPVHHAERHSCITGGKAILTLYLAARPALSHFRGSRSQSIGGTNDWRYVNETVEPLAARAPNLKKAVRGAKRAGHAYVILDGTLIPIDRVARDKPFYSGKAQKARDELTGHRIPGRGHPVGLGRAHAKLRARGEHANEQLKAWKIFSKLRCCPWRAGKPMP